MCKIGVINDMGYDIRSTGVNVVRVKVKCTLVQTLRLCTDRTVHRGSRNIALLFYDHGTRRGWGVSVTPRPLFTPRKDPVPIVQEAGWAPGPVWTPPPGFDPRTVQPVASRYTDYATRSTVNVVVRVKLQYHGFHFFTCDRRTEKHSLTCAKTT